MDPATAVTILLFVLGAVGSGVAFFAQSVWRIQEETAKIQREQGERLRTLETTCAATDRYVEKLGKRTHRLSSIATALLVESKLDVPPGPEDD